MATKATISINIEKINLEQAIKGEKGNYINVEVWVNDKFDEYGNNCSIAQTWKVNEEYKKSYLGNGRAYVARPKPSEQPNSDTQ